MDFLPEIDRKKHEERAKMMEETPIKGVKYGRISPNVRILRQDEVHEARLDALHTYRNLLRAKLGDSTSSRLSNELDIVDKQIEELESGGSE